MSAETISMGHDDEVVEVPVSTLKTNPTKYIDQADQGYRVYVTNRGERIAALVTPEAADAIAETEDAYWARRVAEAEASGAVSWDTAVADLESGRA
ncbi:type II toxin-antitoxin system prevent-host-death family antitoxin [Allosaccharopolyspora coralli]|uniref:Antitoxin n=1 Tax=Allosaccharopolyspora coralli TaxID=2665642 RepID=A0A5Q3QB53_9PSEU|nr:type II toxin-antitoxin system prevent-host-death family antitoxin [Allosaccharopolyspora coralli]QGK68839.1 type II toxin-antitoxin system prevent-host-death family antitoxin [Allosaccharopolyspora coralli]